MALIIEKLGFSNKLEQIVKYLPLFQMLLGNIRYDAVKLKWTPIRPIATAVQTNFPIW